MYLLVFFINRDRVRIKETKGFADAVPRVDLVARSLGALRNEMWAGPLAGLGGAPLSALRGLTADQADQLAAALD